MDRIRGAPKSRYPIREAKDRLPELVRRAARGEQITITLHGEPCARLSRISGGARPFTVDLEWLRGMKVADSQSASTDLIRAERNGRD